MIQEGITAQLAVCHQLVRRNVGDITHEESLRQPEPAGNCLNWVLGHLVATRCAFLRGLGAEPVWTAAECRPYDRHSAPITKAEDARPLEEIWIAYDQSQKRLVEAIAGLTPEKLQQPLPPEMAEAPARNMGEFIAFLGLHDSYHTGQTGVLRRFLGKPPTKI